MKIGIFEEALRFEEVESPDMNCKGEALLSKVCDMLGTMSDEFIVLKKKDGGFIAVPGNAIRSLETDTKE